MTKGAVFRWVAMLAITRSAAALAAQPGADAGRGIEELEEVIVTSEKVEKDLQKTALAIEVYSGKKLTEEGRARMDDILRDVPGVDYQPDGVSMTFTVRGFSAGGIAPSPNGVAVMIDGVTQITPTANQGMRGATLDVSQVELARGTQSTTIGANSLAGAFTLVSNQPVFRYEAQGSLEWGSYRLRNLQGVLNMPLSEHQAMRLAYTSSQRNGYISGGAGESDQSAFRLRYRWQPSDSLNMTLTLFRQNMGGNPTDNNILLATGHWMPFSGQQSVVGFNGITYPTNPVTAPIFQNAGTYTLAAGSRLGPGGIPLPTTTATNYGQICTPGNGLFSTTSTTSPFIASMGCPVSYIAVRDNVPWYDRADPWNDGFPFRGYTNYPYRDTYLSTYAAEIDWKTRLGDWTIIPSYQAGNMYARTVPVGTGNAYIANSEVNPTRELEIRVASKPESSVAWLAGLFASYVPQPEQYNYNVLYPTSGLPTLLRPSVGPNAGTSNALTYVLPVAAGGPATLTSNQAYASGSASCYVFNVDYCYTQNGRNSLNATGAAALYGNLTWPMLDNRVRGLAGVRVTSNYRRQNGRAGGGYLTDSTQSIGSDGLIYFTGTIPAGAANLNCGTATSVNPCTATFATLQRPDTVYKIGWNGDVSYFDGTRTTYARAKRFDLQYRLGLEYDLRSDVMLYGTYSTAKQAPAFDTTTLILPDPLSLGQTTLGMKSRWLDNRLQVNVEVFNNVYHNRPASGVFATLYTLSAGAGVSFSCPTPAPGVVATAVLGATGAGADSCFNRPFTASNTADMYSRGVDFDLTWQLSAADRVTFTAEYLRSKATAIRGVPTLSASDVIGFAAANTSSASSNPGTPAQQTATAQAIADAFNTNLAAAPGSTLQNSPRWAASMSFQHTFTFGDGSRLTPRIDGRYRAEYWSRQVSGDIISANYALDSGRFEPSVQRGYTKWNVYATWSPPDGKWNVAAYINNVTNKAVLLNTSGSTGAGQTVQANTMQLTGGFVTLDAPRTTGVVISARY